MKNNSQSYQENYAEFAKYKYSVNNVTNFDFTETLRLWKTKYKDFDEFVKAVITHPGLYKFSDFVSEMWDSIKPVTAEDALKVHNLEQRRVYFDCIGVESLFKQLKPKLCDRQVIKKKRMRWDDKNDPYEYEFEDVYELYEIKGENLFKRESWQRNFTNVYAVRCWCTTTHREYWIYVSDQAATDRNPNVWMNPQMEPQYDAIRAIAWTVRIDVDNPEKIYRQGDIIVVKMSEQSKQTRTYHLSKEEYLQLMYSET